MEKLLYTANEVCEMLDVSVQTLWRWRKSGKLRAVKISGAVKFRGKDIEKLLEEYLEPMVG